MEALPEALSLPIFRRVNDPWRHGDERVSISMKRHESVRRA